MVGVDWIFLPFCSCSFLFLWSSLPQAIALNPGSDPVKLNGGRGGKGNNIRAFPSRF